MALLFADGFEDGLTDWTLTGTVTATTTNARNGTSVSIGNTQSYYISRSFSPSATVCVGFGFRTSSTGSWSTPDGRGVFAWLYGDAGATQHVGLFIANTGAIYAVRSPIATLGSTAPGIIAANTWYYLEIKTTLHDTTGTFDLQVDGVNRLSLTGIDTKNAGTASAYDRIQIGNTSGGGSIGTILVDDVYICDTTGTANNSLLGDLAVEHIRPIGNDTSQWVGSDADSVNNFALVNEAGAAVTTTYNGSSVVGNRDLYTTSGSVRGAGTIHGVYAVASMAKSDSGAKSAALCIKEGAAGTPRTGTSNALTTGYLNYGQAYDRKADGSAWTFADLQALRIGAEVTA